MSKTLSIIANDKFGFKTILHIIVVLLLFCITQLIASLIVDSFYILTKFNWKTFFVLARCLLEIGLFYLAIRIYTHKVLKVNLSYFRITKPNFSLLWILTAILLPSTVILYYFLFTNGTIYLNNNSILITIAFALKSGLSAGITEEFLFRGFIMKLVENRWNKSVSIILPSIIFASLHLIKGMNSIDVILLFIAGIAVGIMFSLVTYHSETIWNAIIIHTIWNTLILGILCVSPEKASNSIINYVLDNNNILITGGQFGIESALPAIVAYILVIMMTFILKPNHLKPS